MDNYGVVLKRLRVEKSIPIKRAAKLINKSVGWLSEIENGKGFARICQSEFERIVSAYGGNVERQKFSGWIATDTKGHAKPSLCFDGAILKFLREKSAFSLEKAAQALKIHKTDLSKIENGWRPISVKKRNQILEVYGYSPASFKNFNSEDKRSKNVPARFKINIVLNRLNETSLLEVLKFALSLTNGSSATQEMEG